MNMMLVVVLLLCGSATFSKACSCAPPQRPESYCQYDVIFRGQAVSESIQLSAPIEHLGQERYYEWVYSVTVDKVIRMPDDLRGAQTVTIRSLVQGTLCGVRMPLDVDIIFFAYTTDEGGIKTNLCAPSDLWEYVKEGDKQYYMEDLAKDCAKLASKKQG